jgi:hypothetical protein
MKLSLTARIFIWRDHLLATLATCLSVFGLRSYRFDINGDVDRRLSRKKWMAMKSAAAFTDPNKLYNGALYSAPHISGTVARCRRQVLWCRPPGRAKFGTSTRSFDDVGIAKIYAIELINISPSVGNHVALIVTAARRPSVASRRNRLAAAPI